MCMGGTESCVAGAEKHIIVRGRRRVVCETQNCVGGTELCVGGTQNGVWGGHIAVCARHNCLLEAQSIRALTPLVGPDREVDVCMGDTESCIGVERGALL